MKYPFFASIVVLCLLLMYEIHKRRNLEAKKYQEFWDEETKANNTRRQNIDNLDYISIPLSEFPLDLLSEDEQIAEYQNIIKELSTTRILNLTGLSNTELKLKYGAANLDPLSAYDQSYTFMVRTLNDWAHALYKNDHPTEARTLLEFAISTKSDVSASYELLSTIYKENNESEKIKELIPIASEINSLMSKSIVNKLSAML